MPVLLALAATLVGVGVLYASWRWPSEDKWLEVPTAWILIGFGVSAWIRLGGAELGLAYSLIAVTFVAWSFVALGREARHPAERRRQLRVAGARPGRAAILRVVARAFVALPLAGVASVLVSIVLVAGLPWVTANRYVFAILVAPIIWGALAVWVGLTVNLLRVALVLAGVSAASSALLLVR